MAASFNLVAKNFAQRKMRRITFFSERGEHSSGFGSSLLSVYSLEKGSIKLLYNWLCLQQIMQKV